MGRQELRQLLTQDVEGQTDPRGPHNDWRAARPPWPCYAGRSRGTTKANTCPSSPITVVAQDG